MTLRYLVDTNVLSEPTKRFPDAAVVERLQRFASEIATAAPVWNELLYGFHRMSASRRKRVLERHLFERLGPTLQILGYDRRAAEWHAAERARLSQIGLTPPYVDGQIASVAFTNDLVLVTANVSDFANFRGIQMENWSG